MENLLAVLQEALRRMGVGKNDRLLLAISGGVDSVVLAHCCYLLDLNFSCAHCNFQLRKDESDRDEEFVRRLGDTMQHTVFVKKMDTENIARIRKCSIQVAARNLRYEWFDYLIENEIPAFKFIVTAHHLDDNLETMLMHFFRGTGITGICGMPEKNKNIIRPLLSVPKSHLLEFAAERNLEWVEDSSNSSNDYTRNYFRNELLPAIESVFPGVRQNLVNNLRRFSEARELFQQSVDRHKKKLKVSVGAEIHIPVLRLKKSKPTITLLYEIIKEYHFTPEQALEVFGLMDSSTGRYISSKTHRIIKNRKWLIIAPLNQDSAAHFVIEENTPDTPFPEGNLHVKFVHRTEIDSGFSDAHTACLDADRIQFPLVLRKWKNGDYFYPLGMKKKKKIARFLIDQKISKTAKEKTWVLCMENQILWIVGLRIDDRFKVGSSTERTVEIKLNSMTGI